MTMTTKWPDRAKSQTCFRAALLRQGDNNKKKEGGGHVDRHKRERKEEKREKLLTIAGQDSARHPNLPEGVGTRSAVVSFGQGTDSPEPHCSTSSDANAFQGGQNVLDG